MNWPRPSSRAIEPPYTNDGRSSGTTTVKNARRDVAPLTNAASVSSKLSRRMPARMNT